MRIIHPSEITKNIKSMCQKAAYKLPDNVFGKLKNAQKDEISALGKDVLNKIVENNEIAKKGIFPICQDTGIVVCFVKIGHDCHIEGDINAAINTGVEIAFRENFLRKSIVFHPLNRINTKKNTPAIIHIEHVPGNNLKIDLCLKGGGSEGMGRAQIFPPSIGYNGVKKHVLKWVNDAGGKVCPPIILGVGIGGTLEKAALLAKKAILRDIDDSSTDKINNQLELELLKEINQLGIGPMGFGGKTTALAVKVESYPCHLANLPIAICFECHAARHISVVL